MPKDGNVKFEITMPTNLTHISKEVEKELIKALETCGLKMETYAKLNCPVDTGLLRNSIAHAVAGETPSIGANNQGTSKKARTYHSNSIDKNGNPVKKIKDKDGNEHLPGGTYSGKTQKLPGEYAVYVGTNVYYAPYVEMGHIDPKTKHHFKPQPFIEPALKDHLDEYESIIKAALSGGSGNS